MGANFPYSCAIRAARFLRRRTSYKTTPLGAVSPVGVRTQVRHRLDKLLRAKPGIIIGFRQDDADVGNARLRGEGPHCSHAKSSTGGGGRWVAMLVGPLVRGGGHPGSCRNRLQRRVDCRRLAIVLAEQRA